MVTTAELLRVLIVPVLVSSLVAGVGRWRKWAWAMPLAAGAGFTLGYALIGVPRLPPRDGTDWLFWLAIPATLLGILDAVVGKRWGWVLGAAAGGAVLMIGLPLTPHAVEPAALYCTAALASLAGMSVCLAVRVAEPRVTSAAAVAGPCVALGAAAVLVLASGLRIGGVYSIAAAAAVAPIVFLSGKLNAGRYVAIVAVCLLAGLLSGGHYYPDPGISGVHFAVMLLAPATVLIGGLVPSRNRHWPGGVAAIVAVAITVALVTFPAALSAKRASERSVDDPYTGYYMQ